MNQENYPEHLRLKENESHDDYLVRLFDNKEDYEIDNFTIANLMNDVTGDNYGESKYRKDASSYRRWKAYFEDKKGAVPVTDANYKEIEEIKPDGSHISDKLVYMAESDKKDPNFLLEAHGYDSKEWKLSTAKNSLWNARSKEDGVLTLYSSRIVAKPKDGTEIDFEDIKEGIKSIMKDFKPKSYIPTRYKTDGKLLELNISDLHLNKMGYVKGEYDSELAEKIFFHIINDVLTRTEEFEFEKILFIWSHDFFNVDGLTGTTTAGTPQSTNMRYSDMYKKGMKMLVEGIDIIKKVAPVETVQVGANHDRLTSYTMSEVLNAWFRDDENVTIDNDPLSRKYKRFGKCLIGFSHGDKEKRKLGKLMPMEVREDWGETYYSEIHAGHLHSEQAVKEENGVIVRHLSSPSGTDNWHFESGWIGSIPKAQSFIWDKELGLTDIIHTPLLPNYENIKQ